MATSGRIQTATVNYTHGYVKFQFVRNEIGNNRSLINWQSGINISSGAYWQLSAIRIDGGNVHTNGIPVGTWSNLSGNGDKELRSGSVWVEHNSAGAGSFGYAVNYWFYGFGNRTASGGSGALPTIPRNATITGGTSTFNDTQNPTINYSNPAGTAITTLQAAIYKTDGMTAAVPYTNISKTGSSYTFSLTEPQRNTLRSWAANTKSMTIRIYLRSVIGGVDERPHRNVTLTITGGEPTFSDFTFEDTNPDTIAVTGNDKVLIQGRSTLRATVPVADRATANKQATVNTYTFTIGGYSQSSSWSNTIDVVKDIGVITDVTGAQTLTVRATDSRSNSTAVSKQTTIVPYSGPGFFYALTVKYSNSFDASGGLTTTGYSDNAIAIVSPMTYGGVDLNEVNATSGVKFDISRGDDPWTGTFENIPITQEAGTGLIRVNKTALATQILSRMNSIGANNTVPWYIWFQITDKLSTHNYVLVIDVGRPIMRIGYDENLYYQEQEFSTVFNPTSHIYIPSRGLFAGSGGGTWGYETITGTPPSGAGPVAFTNSATKQQYTYMVAEVFLSPGIYTMTLWCVRAPDAPLLAFYQDGISVFTAAPGSGFDLYSATTQVGYKPTLSGIPIETAGIYQFAVQASDKNAASSSYYMRVFGVDFYKTGYLA